MNKISVLLLVFSSMCVARVVDSAFIPFVDSLFELYDSEQITCIRNVKDEHTFYLSYTCKTIEFSIDEIKHIIDFIGDYNGDFKHILQAELYYDTLNGRIDTSAFFVMGVPFAVSWFKGKRHARFSKDSTDYIVSLINNKADTVSNIWKKNVKGFIKVGFHEVDMFFKIRQLDERRCRVALYASVAPTIWVPKWLFKVASKKVFPGMLTDMENVLNKSRIEETTNKRLDKSSSSSKM